MKEKDLYQYLERCCYTDLVMAKNPLSKWDCYSPVARHRIELKCRAKHYDTLIIEKIKYDALIKKAIDNDDQPIYINSTPKGVYRFNLFLVTPVWEIKYLKKTTTFTNTNKVAKQIAMLPVIDAELL